MNKDLSQLSIAEQMQEVKRRLKENGDEREIKTDLLMVGLSEPESELLVKLLRKHDDPTINALTDEKANEVLEAIRRKIHSGQAYTQIEEEPIQKETPAWRKVLFVIFIIFFVIRMIMRIAMYN